MPMPTMWMALIQLLLTRAKALVVVLLACVILVPSIFVGYLVYVLAEERRQQFTVVQQLMQQHNVEATRDHGSIMNGINQIIAGEMRIENRIDEQNRILQIICQSVAVRCKFDASKAQLKIDLK